MYIETPIPTYAYYAYVLPGSMNEPARVSSTAKLFVFVSRIGMRGPPTHRLDQHCISTQRDFGPIIIFTAGEWQYFSSARPQPSAL